MMTLLITRCAFCIDWRRHRMFTGVRQRFHVNDARSGHSCPSPAGCLMQLLRYGRRRRTQDADSRQPGDDIGMTADSAGERSSCCRCSDGSGAGGGRLTAFVDACAASSAVDRCRLPRCKWWKSLCTRVYLIAVNLASFVSFLVVFKCRFTPLLLFSRSYCTQYDRFLASYCRPSVRLSVCPSVTLCIVAGVLDI